MWLSCSWGWCEMSNRILRGFSISDAYLHSEIMEIGEAGQEISSRFCCGDIRIDNGRFLLSTSHRSRNASSAHLGRRFILAAGSACFNISCIKVALKRMLWSTHGAPTPRKVHVEIATDMTKYAEKLRPTVSYSHVLLQVIRVAKQ